MRVIAGSLRGRRLLTPSWDGLRPTSDRLRETMFNILAPRIEGAGVLDGYAGTGAIGIEALSRGAASVTFVDHDRRAHALIERNLAHCGIVDGYAIIRASMARALEMLRERAVTHPSRPFDIILLDPPYESIGDTIEPILVAAGETMAPDGLLVLEHGRRRQPPDAVGPLHRSRDVTAGDSALAFYEVRR